MKIKIKFQSHYFVFTLLIAAVGFFVNFNHAKANAVSTNSFTEYSQVSNSYPSDTISGISNPIPDNAVIVELGYGSDDHDYYMGAAQGEFYDKGSGAWGVRPAGAKVDLAGVERRGVMVSLNSDAGWNAPADTYLSRWGWASSNTSGGHGNDDGYPDNVCVLARYKLFDPITHVIDNSQTYDSSNCTNYSIPNDIRGWVRADDNKFFTNIGQFQFGNDAKLRGGFAYIRRIASQVLNSQYVSDTVPRTELEPSSQHQAVIRMKNTGTVSWIGDNFTRTSGNCDNFPIIGGSEPTPAGATCTETYQVSSNSYKLKKTSGFDSRLSAPDELSYSYSTTRVVQAVEVRNEICVLVYAPKSLWQKFVSWFIPKAFARLPGPGGDTENCYPGEPEMVASIVTAPKFNIDSGEEVDFPITFTSQSSGGIANLVYSMVQKGNSDILFGDLATIPVTIGTAPPQSTIITSNVVKGTLTRSPADFSLQCSPSMIVVQLDSNGVPTSPVQFNVSARTLNGFDDTVNLSLSSSDPGLLPEFITSSTVNPSHTAAQNPPNNRDVQVTGTWTSGMHIISADGLGLDGVTTANPPCDVYLDVRPLDMVVDSLDISPVDATINKNATQPYVVTAHFTNGTTIVVTDSSICSSSNTSVASIPSGGNPCVATGIAVGTSQISATYTYVGVTVYSNNAILRVIDIILPEAPDVTVNVNGACETVIVNWTGPNSGPQPDHFQVYRSTGPLDKNFQAIGSPIEYSAPRVFVDGNPLSLQTGNYYGVRSILGTEYSVLHKAGPIIPTPCAPNLDTSDKDLIRVNNKTNNSAEACGVSDIFILPNKGVFVTGSKVYFNINVCNSGNQKLTNLRVEESPSDTLTNLTLENPRGACSLTGGSGAGPYLLNDLEAPPLGGKTVCTIQVSATLSVPNSRSASYSPIPTFLYRFWNKATIYSQELAPKVVSTPPYLFSDTGAPVRNETAP